MVPLFLVVVLCLGASNLFGQVQERKLIDRLLQPDLRLVNSAQGKQFSDTKRPLTSRTFETRCLRCPQIGSSKRLARVKSFPGRKFVIGKFLVADSPMDPASNQISLSADRKLLGNQSSIPRSAGEKNKTSPTREYTGARPFLSKGTRQDIFDQQQRQHPLTIEEVRELLNKND